MVFAVAAVLREGKAGGGGGVGRGGGRAGRAREKEGDAGGVGGEGVAVSFAQLGFFVAHDGGIKGTEVGDEDEGTPPGIPGDGEAGGHDGAAEIERIAGPGVGAGGGEGLDFAEVSGGGGADGEADDGDGGADENGAVGGASEPPVEDGERVACANAPACNEAGHSLGVLQERLQHFDGSGADFGDGDAKHSRGVGVAALVGSFVWLRFAQDARV